MKKATADANWKEKNTKNQNPFFWLGATVGGRDAISTVILYWWQIKNIEIWSLKNATADAIKSRKMQKKITGGNSWRGDASRQCWCGPTCICISCAIVHHRTAAWQNMKKQQNYFLHSFIEVCHRTAAWQNMKKQPNHLQHSRIIHCHRTAAKTIISSMQVLNTYQIIATLFLLTNAKKYLQRFILQMIILFYFYLNPERFPISSELPRTHLQSFAMINVCGQQCLSRYFSTNIECTNSS